MEYSSRNMVLIVWRQIREHFGSKYNAQSHLVAQLTSWNHKILRQWGQKLNMAILASGKERIARLTKTLLPTHQGFQTSRNKHLYATKNSKVVRPHWKLKVRNKYILYVLIVGMQPQPPMHFACATFANKTIQNRVNFCSDNFWFTQI